jgi:hypothetical protein
VDRPRTIREWLFCGAIFANCLSALLALTLDHKVDGWGTMHGHIGVWAHFVIWGQIAYICGFILSWFGRRWLRILSLLATPFLVHMWTWRGIIG